MFALLRPALVSMGLFTLLLGFAYPLAITAFAQAALPVQANGSLVRDGGQVVGSSLIGQAFSSPGYLHSRPSAAGADGYDASASSGSNLGPMDARLIAQTKERAAALRAEDGAGPVPADAVTASASGLDPDISPAYAQRQAARIAAARGAPAEQVRALLARQVKGRTLGVLGQPRVNVLAANLALDATFGRAQPSPR